MKLNNPLGLTALSLIFILSTSLSAQTAQVATADKGRTEISAAAKVFEYADVTLSDPSIYGDEPFSISLTVKNAGKLATKQEIQLMLKDDSASKGKRKQSVALLSLIPGQSEKVTFTFTVKDLLKQGQKAPESFVFYLGEFEIAVPVERK